MDPLASSGMDPKTADAVRKFVGKTVDQAVEKAVEKALRPSGVAAQSRPQDATQNTTSKVIIILTGIIALAAVISVQLGAFYWLNDSIRDEIGSVRDEVIDLRERVIRIEILIEDRLPSTP